MNFFYILLLLSIITCSCSKEKLDVNVGRYQHINSSILANEGGDDDDDIIIMEIVSNSLGNPIEGCEVMYTKGGDTIISVTDAQGEAKSTLTTKGDWTLNLEHQSYSPFKITIHVDSTYHERTDTLYP